MIGVAGLAALLGADPQAAPRPVTPGLVAEDSLAGDPRPSLHAVAVAPEPLPFGASVVRGCDLAAGVAALRDAGLPPESVAYRDARTVLGLAARACGQADEAVVLLDLPPHPAGDPTGTLEDWRLFGLAQAASAVGAEAKARAAADAVLRDHPDSPLHTQARTLRARIALDSGDATDALRLATPPAAERDLAGRAELGAVAWEAALALADQEAIREAGRRLLIDSPIEAMELEVAETLAPTGSPGWSALLSPDELVRRAERLVDDSLLKEAFDALDAVPAGQRDLAWRTARARALVEDQRGTEALALLGDVESLEGDRRIDLLWLRAQAAFEAATVRRGRRNLSTAERDVMRARARGDLWRVVEEGGDDELVVAALRRSFDELAGTGDFSQIRTVLERLRAHDPRDTSGARYVFRLGWDAFVAGDYRTALVFWTELDDLYPESSHTRSGRYWSGLSHQALGDPERATATLEAIAASPATDYYRKHALRRLGRSTDEPAPPAAVVPRDWPTDPALSRAARLTDLGLDQAATIELDLLASGAAEPAVTALRSRILANEGRRRDSIQNLWRVFPMLGTAEQMQVPDDALRMYYPVDFLDIVRRFAADNRLPVPLLLAMIRQESAFDVQARSWAGARGLMQVMPATGRELAERMGLPYTRERLDEPSFSVQLGSRYFRQMLDMFDDDLELALAGYNAGPYRIRKMVAAAGSTLEPDRFLESLRIEESKTYVKRIVLFSNTYRQLYPELG